MSGKEVSRMLSDAIIVACFELIKNEVFSLALVYYFGSQVIICCTKVITLTLNFCS